MYKKALYQGIILFCLFSFGIFLFFSPSISLAQNSVAKKNNGTIQIKAEKGLLSVQLKDAPIPQVLQEIARQTGIQFNGWEKTAGQKVTEQFKNLPLDEGLRKISQNFVIILKKTGQEGQSLQVKKVVIIAQKNAPSPNSKTQTKSSLLPHPARPAGALIKAQAVAQSSAKNEANQKAPQYKKIKLQRKINRKPSKPQKPVSNKLKPHRTAKSRHKGKGKKKKVSTKTASLAPLTSPDRDCGEQYFKQKRWDKAIACFAKYLKQNPSNQQVKEKLETAKQNAEQAISLYQQGRKLENDKDLSGAYERYKKSCDIYPLLYDTWERMKALKGKIKK